MKTEWEYQVLIENDNQADFLNNLLKLCGWEGKVMTNTYCVLSASDKRVSHNFKTTGALSPFGELLNFQDDLVELVSFIKANSKKTQVFSVKRAWQQTDVVKVEAINPEQAIKKAFQMPPFNLNEVSEKFCFID